MYPGYCKYTADKLLKDAVLVLDTNILLSIIKFPNDYSEKIINIFSKYNLTKALFIPGTVGSEVIKQLDRELDALDKQYTTIDNKLDNFIPEIENIFKGQGKKTYPITDTKEIIEIIKKHFTEIKKEIEPKKEEKKDTKKLRETILDLMNFVGPEYNEESKSKLIPIIQEKYKKGLYPGYKDSSKPEETKYNDAFIWQQTIDYSMQNKKDIIFVTGDIKDDWWNINSETKKRTIKKPMINEFMVTTGQKIQLLTLDEFFEKYNSQLPKEEKVDSKQMKDIVEYIKEYDNQSSSEMFSAKDYIENYLNSNPIRTNYADWINGINYESPNSLIGLTTKLNDLNLDNFNTIDYLSDIKNVLDTGYLDSSHKLLQNNLWDISKKLKQNTAWDILRNYQQNSLWDVARNLRQNSLYDAAKNLKSNDLTSNLKEIKKTDSLSNITKNENDNTDKKTDGNDKLDNDLSSKKES